MKLTNLEKGILYFLRLENEYNEENHCDIMSATTDRLVDWMADKYAGYGFFFGDRDTGEEIETFHEQEVTEKEVLKAITSLRKKGFKIVEQNGLISLKE